jgi:hypothetical protein
MSKVKIESNIIINPERIVKNNVVTITVSNMDTSATTFYFNGVERKLPAIDISNNIPVGAFEISACGHDFDIDLQFTQRDTKIIVDYAYLIDNTDKKC